MKPGQPPFGVHLKSAVLCVEAFDMKTRSKAGHPVWLNVSILRLADAGPASPVTVHLFRDVTANKELLALVHERLAATAEREAGHDPTAVLSRREVEVLRLLALGFNTSRLEAVAYATRHRLL